VNRRVNGCMRSQVGGLRGPRHTKPLNSRSVCLRG
jgi:hypothetical protein